MPKITSASPRNFGTARGTAQAAGAERQRMRLGKGRLAAEAGGDGNGESFGEPLQLRPGLGVMHALAGIDHRPLGVDEQRRRFLDMHGIGAVARAQHRRVVERLRHFLVPHVGGDFDDHRSAAAVLQSGEGAAEDVGDLGGDDDRLGRFRERLHRLAGIEVRLDVGDAPRHSPSAAPAPARIRRSIARHRPWRSPRRDRAACRRRRCLLPEVTREIASAMWMPMRSCRTMIGRMSAFAAYSIRWLTG